MSIRPRSVQYFIIGIALGLLALLVSGCAELRYEDWDSVPEQRQPRADQVQYAHDVRFRPGLDRLSTNERQRLVSFLQRAGAGRNDSVHVAGPQAGGKLSDRREETVVAYLDHLNLKTLSLADGFAVGEPGADVVRVILRRHVVTLPGCPDWSGRPGNTWQNMPSSNWGCATASNLGMMVANPADLARGRKMGPADGEFSATSIDRYRKGETTPLDPEDISVIEGQQKTGGGGGQ